MSKPNVVVMGAGSGIYPVITALKHFDVDIATIISVADSGGSTGRIRDEFGFQPVGDLRQSLAALAEDEGQEWIRKLLLYRFDKGTGLKGHNLGNLILTALQDMTGDTDSALLLAEKIFRLEGDVIPVTKDNVHLKIHFQNGESEIGEHILDEEADEYRPIDHVTLTPDATINPRAVEALKAADLVIIGPGDFYASLMATLAPSGIEEALAASSAKVMYIVNLMTRFTQTHQMSAREHVVGIEQAIARQVDYILINAGEIPPAVLERYEASKEYTVEDDMGDDPRVMRADVVSGTLKEQAAHDTAHRSLLRHDSKKLQQSLQPLIDQLSR